MRDTKDFNERFLRWKNGENYWDTRGVSLNTNSDQPATKELVELIKSRLAKFLDGKDGDNPRPITTSGAGYIPPAPNINPINLPNSVKEARMRLYNKVSPVWGFTDDTVKAFFDTMLYGDNVFAQTVGEKDEFGFKNPPVIIDDPYVDAVWAEYLQIPENKRRSKYKLQKSKYRPTIGDENVTYYTIPINERAKEELVNEGIRIPLNKNKTSTTLMGYNHGEHTVGKGFDPQKGEYISYYDRWDLNPFSSRYSSETKLKNNSILKKLGLLDNRKYGDLSFGLGKPLDFYDRIYLDDYFGINQPIIHATWLPEVVVTPTYRKGKDFGIYINKNDL